MVCALTVRTLEPGAFDQFRAAFMEGMEHDPPEGWVRFSMIRNAEMPDEVICFGVFDGTVEEVRSSAARHGYAQQLERIAPFVRSVGTDGLYDVVEDLVAEPASPA